MPWWAALLIAITATAIGYAIDAGSGHKDLTHVFAGLYIAGCVAAVLAVRQDGVFTAIIQPPLILFCAVPGAYWLFHGRKVGNLKDLLINCGYPLIERFPLMLGTAGGVLLIGLVRWYFRTSQRTSAATNTKDDTDAAAGVESKSLLGGILAKLQSALRPGSDEDDADGAATSADARRARSAARSAKSPRTAGSGRSTARPSRAHSRHARPPLDDELEPTDERPRRPRSRGATPRDFDPADPPRRSRRRPRPEADADEPRADAPREVRREQGRRRNAYERPAPRSGRLDAYDRYEPPATPEHFNRYEPYEPYERPYEPQRRRAATGGTNGANPSHHPISRVRYRGASPLDEPISEPRPEPRPDRRRSRTPGRSQGRPPAESWEYDV